MKRKVKDAIYSNIANLTKSLSSSKRLEILDLLSQSEKTVETVAEQAELGIKNASAQLKELKSARLLDSRKDGKYVYYFLADTSVAQFWVQLRAFSHQRISELQKITADALSLPNELENVDRKNLLSRAKRGDVVILDIRPEDEFASAHLPYAVSVPLSSLSKHLKTLPKDKEIVAYCRGPYCFFAKEAVEILRKKGFKAKQLTESVHDWESHGLPLDRDQNPGNSKVRV